ncbi:hypothetical protein [Streptomyces sp. CNQ085]|uniref:hypothetical protein n=1 Tax=Streptomyces sp. CNQ085 TaxID=2886944 RepID=UPI001F506D4C|nr:hypothetical protein [Streptomyces sp. CNQ085]MCI0386105.1 hypothetical protein [Streptomyces sp. CNQ085]
MAAHDRLDTEFLEVVRGAGTSTGGLYLLSPDGDVLRLAMLCGAPLDRTLAAAPS